MRHQVDKIIWTSLQHVKPTFAGQKTHFLVLLLSETNYFLHSPKSRPCFLFCLLVLFWKSLTFFFSIFLSLSLCSSVSLSLSLSLANYITFSSILALYVFFAWFWVVWALWDDVFTDFGIKLWSNLVGGNTFTQLTWQNFADLPAQTSIYTHTFLLKKQKLKNVDN